MNVSIVIPLYNKACEIRRALDSVMRQTFSEFECIVVDDGSTDGSGTIVERIKDPRIRLIRQPNAGEGAARNTGILAARSELVAFLDADDEWLPNFLNTVISLHERYPTAGMYATSYLKCQEEVTLPIIFLNCVTSPEGFLLEDYFHSALGPPPVTSSSVMIPKRVLLEVGLFPVGVRRGADLQTWAAIALRYRVAWSPVVGAIYHLSATNRACQTYCVTEDVTPALPVDAFLSSGGKPVSSPFYIQEYLVNLRLDYVKIHALAGKKDWALEMIRQTAGTVIYRRKRLFLQFCLLFPAWLLRAFSRALRVIRKPLGY